MTVEVFALKLYTVIIRLILEILASQSHTFPAVSLKHLLSIGVGSHDHVLESRPHVGALPRSHSGSLPDHSLTLKI